MNAFWLLIGVLLGAGLVAAVLLPRLRAGTSSAHRAVELDRELVRACADLDHERARAKERLETVNDAQERLSASFKALSAEALQTSMTQLAEMSKAQLQVALAQANGELDKRQHAVEQLVAPLKEQLGRVDSQLTRLDQERRESRGRLEAQLRSLNETGERLRTETGALVTALRKPNARGQWGQMQLRNVVELAGMVRHCDFAEQTSVAGEDSTLRPDLVVSLPGGKKVVVDAKAPLQGVLDAYQARDETEREQFLRDHARLLRKHVKALAEKAYWAGLDTTPDFVERVAESAQAISDLGRDLHARLVRLSTLVATLGTRLNSTVKAYNETVGSYEARVLPAARRFADHGAVSEGSELAEIEHVTTAARNVNAPELTLELGVDEPRRLRAAE